MLEVILLKSDSAQDINGCNLIESISSRAVQLKPWLKGLWFNNFLITAVYSGSLSSKLSGLHFLMY